jgi:hypothetical protein
MGVEHGAGGEQTHQGQSHLPADRFNIGTQQAFDTRHEISSVSRVGKLCGIELETIQFRQGLRQPLRLAEHAYRQVVGDLFPLDPYPA